MLYHMMCLWGALFYIPWDFYWIFGRKLFPINLDGNQKISIKLNSNILYKLLDLVGGVTMLVIFANTIP
jgi:hypothetical protein